MGSSIDPQPNPQVNVPQQSQNVVYQNQNMGYMPNQFNSPYTQQQQAMYYNMYTNQPLTSNSHNGPGTTQQPMLSANAPKPQTVHTLNLDVSFKKESLKLVNSNYRYQWETDHTKYNLYTTAKCLQW
jgi:hypothetical protein